MAGHKKVSVMTYYHKTSAMDNPKFLDWWKDIWFVKALGVLAVTHVIYTLIYNNHCFYKRTMKVLISLPEGLSLLFFFF